jgi:signal transduction histidine kinase/AraC-like DNA-binding protein/ligand-binding sensor domain-containing protein
MSNSIKHFSTLVIAALLGITNILAQSTRFFDQSSMSSSQLSSIAQDREGYLWIGSSYGLMRFDGNSFKSWIHTDNNSNSIIDNRVLKVLVTNNNMIQIATANGLQSYNPSTHQFSLTKLPDKSFNGYISDISELRDGSLLFVASGVAVYKMSKDGKKVTPIKAAQSLKWLNQLNLALECGNGYIFSGQQGDIAIVDKNGKITEHKLCSAPIIEMVKDNIGNIIIISSTQIWRYNNNSNKFNELQYSGAGSPSFKNAHCGKSGTIYITTSGNGIKQVAPNSNSITDCNKWKNNTIDIARAKLNVVYEDKDANLWIGCTNKGLLMAENKTNQFSYMSVNKMLSGADGYILDLAYDNLGYLWCSVEDFGIYKINHSGEIVSSIPTSMQINRLTPTADGGMIAGVNNKGLFSINAACNSITEIASIDGTYNITAITSDKPGNIYAAIDGRGIVIINPLTKESNWLYPAPHPEMINSWIPALCIDSKQRLWIGHYSGLSCYDTTSKNFIAVKNDDGLRQSVCNAIAVGKNNEIWVATNLGLVRYNPSSGKIDRYNYNNGIGDNSFIDVVTDANGNLWATTRKGINKFDTKTLKFTAFYGGGGLDDNLYNRIATNANASRISFSGQSGITAFQPSNIQATKIEATPVVTDIAINGISYEQATNKKALHKDGNAIKLEYSENAIALTLSTLDFRNAKNVSYQYKLSNSSAWISTNVGDNVININNLTPGNYKLQIRACENGVYSPIKIVEINVASPWFLTPLAKIIYLALILALCWQIYLTLRRKRDNQIKDAKLQFFINISHEIRSPMTLILSPLEALMKQDFDTKTKQRLNTIHRNATRILDLVNQLLDIRKIDKGKMDIHCTETNLVSFVNEFTDMFMPKAEEKHITLSFESTEPELNAWIDRNNFDKVLVNLITNAFKYTPKDGEIHIELTQGSDPKVIGPLRQYAMIRVIDSGIGIDEKKTEKIFERFYQDNAKIEGGTPAGFGIGLNLCKLLVELHHGSIKAYNRTDAQGSCFEVKIPLGDSHLSKQEKIADNTEKSRAIIAKMVSTDNNNPQPTKSVRHRSKYRILVVDDDIEIRSYLSDYFAAYYKVDAVPNGAEAWKHILSTGADLVISDVNMPEMNGFQLLKNIKTNGNTNHIPVILLTSKTEYADRKEGWEKGADAYLAKPFNGEELLAITDSLIENRIMLKGRFSGAQSQEDKIDKIEIKSNSDVLMGKIIEMINAHIDDPNLNVEMLGQEVGISRAHLHRKMKDMIGVSPSDFIRTIRLRKACEMLKETDNDVTQIAYSIGFTSQTHFSTAFKKFMGLSPSEYRAQQSKKVD